MFGRGLGALGSLLGGVEAQAFVCVLLRAYAQVDWLALDVAGVQTLEEWHAPPAPSAGAEALADEAGDGRILGLQERAHLAERDTEAEADLVVGVHAG